MLHRKVNMKTMLMISFALPVILIILIGILGYFSIHNLRNYGLLSNKESITALKRIKWVAQADQQISNEVDIQLASLEERDEQVFQIYENTIKTYLFVVILSLLVFVSVDVFQTKVIASSFEMDLPENAPAESSEKRILIDLMDSMMENYAIKFGKPKSQVFHEISPVLERKANQ